MKISQIIELSSIISKIISKDMPFSLAYKFAKLSKIISSNTEFYDQKMRELLEKYLQKDENGNYIEQEGGWLLIPETKGEFYEKLNELKNIEISDEVPKFNSIELDSISITPQDLIVLMPLIEE